MKRINNSSKSRVLFWLLFVLVSIGIVSTEGVSVTNSGNTRGSQNAGQSLYYPTRVFPNPAVPLEQAEVPPELSDEGGESHRRSGVGLYFNLNYHLTGNISYSGPSESGTAGPYTYTTDPTGDASTSGTVDLGLDIGYNINKKFFLGMRVAYQVNEIESDSTMLTVNGIYTFDGSATLRYIPLMFNMKIFFSENEASFFIDTAVGYSITKKEYELTYPDPSTGDPVTISGGGTAIDVGLYLGFGYVFESGISVKLFYQNYFFTLSEAKETDYSTGEDSVF